MSWPSWPFMTVFNTVVTTRELESAAVKQGRIFVTLLNISSYIKSHCIVLADWIQSLQSYMLVVTSLISILSRFPPTISSLASSVRHPVLGFSSSRQWSQWRLRPGALADSRTPLLSLGSLHPLFILPTWQPAKQHCAISLLFFYFCFVCASVSPSHHSHLLLSPPSLPCEETAALRGV